MDGWRQNEDHVKYLCECVLPNKELFQVSRALEVKAQFIIYLKRLG